MELVIDNNFKQTYEFYYNDLRDKLIIEVINGMFTNYDAELVVDAVNIIKTSIALGSSYTECYDRVIGAILQRFPLGDDIDKFIISLVIKVMIATGAPDIEELIRSPRNINREVTAKHFRIPSKKITEQMIQEVMDASDKFTDASYSITDPPVESWDEYFYNICRQIARNSKCLSRRIGAILVQDKSIVSTGYNGPPSGIPRCDNRWELDKEFATKYDGYRQDKVTKGICPRRIIGFNSGEGLGICPASHAEVNTIINAAKNGICTKGSTLYMSCGIPCSNCLKEIINAGIKEMVVLSLKTYDENSLYLLNNSDLGIRLFGFTIQKN
jgi:dCMP deaminase